MKTSGRPLKNPGLGEYVPYAVKIPRKVRATLRVIADRRKCTQSDVIVAAILKEAQYS